jgi:hypothetical protein
MLPLIPDIDALFAIATLWGFGYCDVGSLPSNGLDGWDTSSGSGDCPQTPKITQACR